MLTDNNTVALAIFKLPQTLSTLYFWGFCKKFLEVRKKRSGDPLYGVSILNVPLVLT